MSKSNAGAKSAQASPVNNISSSGLPAISNKSRGIGHVRHLSGNTSTESGSGGGAGSTNTSGSGGVHPYYGTPNNTSQAKVKFREQGVDELLQLKLHQAIAATDHVPEGSTIVLATGDGNVGQFNEDGFLGVFCFSTLFRELYLQLLTLCLRSCEDCSPPRVAS